MNRSLDLIAAEIAADWKKPNYAAQPYLEAMSCLVSMDDNYYADSAASVVAYFLANAGGWRGDVAKRVKLELNAMLKAHYKK